MLVTHVINIQPHPQSKIMTGRDYLIQSEFDVEGKKVDLWKETTNWWEF